jgi:NAD(P)H-flavin reductase
MAPRPRPTTEKTDHDPMTPNLYRVRQVRRETLDTFTLEFEPLEGPHPVFAPGQFNMLYVFGAGEVPISISGDPTQTHPLVHTVRAVGAVTDALCRLKRGGVVGVRGPFGSHWPIKEAEGSDVLIVGGGLGLAPLRPALYHLLANRGRYGNVVLLYGTRTPQDLLFRRELQRWRGRFDLQVEVTVDNAIGEWPGHVGVVTTMIPRAEFDPDETVALVCGPEIMMRFTVAELKGRGLSPQKIHVSMERNMKCGIGLCGHCQFGPTFVCKDGPVFPWADIEHLLKVREV